jgi:hypothetical protein
LLAALLVGPPADATSAPAAIVRPPAETLRSEYTDLMRCFAERRRPEPAAVVPRLCVLHRQLVATDNLIRTDRRRLVRGVENRLVELHGRLIRERRAAKLSGGASAARADELIRLIQATVAPETWDVNGGRGTIGFWSPHPALVIRQAGEVHHQVGATLQALRE